MRALVLSVVVVFAAGACSSSEVDPRALLDAPIAPADEIGSVDAEPRPVAVPADHTVREASLRPAWLGMRPLTLRADGYGLVQQTPDELADRRLPPPSSAELAARSIPVPDLPEPPTDGSFAGEVMPVPDEVLERSTWSSACPVGVDELRYLLLTFWGFDDRPHMGEMVVHASVADDIVEVFRRVFEARFPIEEMRVVSPGELDIPPTGDGNNTTGFVCRPVTSGSSWSRHAYGLGVDVNPFHNPYVRGSLVIPELASAYVDRGDHRPGMIQSGGVVVGAFGAIGWPWGGDWSSAKDWMHFSDDGR